MLLFVCVALVYTGIPSEGHERGPHHPRGSSVAKHHVHYKPTREGYNKLTEDEELLHDPVHLQEHLGEMFDEPDVSKMTDEELEFYYFQVHDSDKNSKLDGLEILQAILHTSLHDDDHQEDHEPNVDDTEYYIELIDRVLSEDDSDNDGYLSYAEYAASRRRNKNAQESEPSVKMLP